MRDKITFQNILMMRTCPPDKVLFSGSPEVDGHVLICPMCKERLAEGPGELLSLRMDFESVCATHAPAPGEIRKISADLAGWEAGRHYNPTDVLVLKKIDPLAYEVAQVSFDLGFCSLEDDIRIDDLGAFIEPWNTYTMAGWHLGARVFALGREDLDLVLLKTEHKFFSPDENSYLYLFRQTEMETGSFFARQSVAWLMQRHDSLLSQLEPAELQRLLLQKYPGIEEPGHVQDPFFLLARSRLPGQLLARAASDVDSLGFNHLVFQQDDFELYSVLARITRQIVLEDGLEISGQLPLHIDVTEMHAWWENNDRIISPAEVEFEAGRPYFRLRFTNPDATVFEKGMLILLTIGHE